MCTEENLSFLKLEGMKRAQKTCNMPLFVYLFAAFAHCHLTLGLNPTIYFLFFELIMSEFSHFRESFDIFFYLYETYKSRCS